MQVASYQFRVCQNPGCGLRYPLLEGSPFGERCPLCLGATEVAATTMNESEPGCQEVRAPIGHRLVALLDNIRSAWNVGSIFRSADGFGLRHLYLCGITPTPENDQVRKTALGAECSVSWSSHRNAVALLAELKARGCTVWALERNAKSGPIAALSTRQSLPGGAVLVVGNEQAGVDPDILSLADEIIRIDMRGRKRSLNVAVAFAVAAHALSRS